MQQLSLTYVCALSNKVQPLGKKLIICFCSSVHARPLHVYQLSKDPDLWSAEIRNKGAKIMYSAVACDWWGRQEVIGSAVYSCDTFPWEYSVLSTEQSHPGMGSGKAGTGRALQPALRLGKLHRSIHLRRQKSNPNSGNTAWTKGDTIATYSSVKQLQRS